MKKIIGFVRNVFYTTSAIFFAVSAFLIIVFTAVGEMNEDAVFQFSLLTDSMLFAFISGLAITVFASVPKLSYFRYALDFVFSYGAFYLSFFYLTGRNKQFSQIFSLSTLFVIVFAAVCGLSVLFRKLENGKKTSEEYESIYSEPKKDKDK